MSAAVESSVRASLEEVIDPCSCFTSTPMSIVDLGLVQEVKVTRAAIAIHLCMTDPMCMYFPNIASEIERRLGHVGEGRRISVHWDTDADWSPDLMNPDVRQARADALMRRFGLEPRRKAAEGGEQ